MLALIVEDTPTTTQLGVKMIGVKINHKRWSVFPPRSLATFQDTDVRVEEGHLEFPAALEHRAFQRPAGTLSSSPERPLGQRVLWKVKQMHAMNLAIRFSGNGQPSLD